MSRLWIFASSILLMMGPCQTKVLADPVPEGYPQTFQTTVTGSAAYDGMYTWEWVEPDAVNWTITDFPAALSDEGIGGTIDVLGAGQIYSDTSSGNLFTGAFEGGAFTITSGTLGGDGGFAGGTLSIPEAGGLAASSATFFLIWGRRSLRVRHFRLCPSSDLHSPCSWLLKPSRLSPGAAQE